MTAYQSVQQAYNSFRCLLTAKQKLRTKWIYFYSSCIAFADIIGLSSMVPVLMLAIDQSFLEKSSKLRWLYQLCGFTSEGMFLQALIAFIMFFFIIKSILAIWLFRFIRKTAIDISNSLASRSFQFAFRNNTYEKVAQDGLGFHDNVMFTPYYYVAGIYMPFITLVSETAVAFMLVAIFTIYKPSLFILLAGLLGTAFYLVNRYTRLKIAELGEEGSKYRDNALKQLNFGVSGFTDIKTHQVENYFKNKFIEQYHGWVKSGIKAVNFQLIPARINELVALLGIVLLVIYGYFFARENLGQVRVLAALFVISVFRLIPAANRLLQSLMHLKLNGYTIQALSGLVKKQADEAIIHHFEKSIEFKNVSYSYNSSSNPILENVNIEIVKGSLTGISGDSGSGKTTLVKLLLGIIQPTAGDYCLDGKLLSNDIGLYPMFSYMGQEPFILNGTVLENVALGKEADEVDAEKAKQCLKMAAFDLGVNDALGLNVGENGGRLSEGQKQRLVLARELYRDAPVFILDEPTSSLDEQTESEILKTLVDLNQKGKTIIIIAHRPRIFDLCNSVYNINNKKVTKLR